MVYVDICKLIECLLLSLTVKNVRLVLLSLIIFKKKMDKQKFCIQIRITYNISTIYFCIFVIRKPRIYQMYKQLRRLSSLELLFPTAYRSDFGGGSVRIDATFEGFFL